MPSLTTARHTLKNGLTVILREVHTAPVVSSWLWYKVGSRNESTGMTGAAHFVEHMMFKGTPSYPKGQADKLIARNGGMFNAFTSADYTCYFETLPADKLDLGLSIEADRMANSIFDPQEFEAERTVIISEREGLENEPEFLLMEELGAAAFKVHPYHHETIGWKSDIQSLTRDQLYRLYRTYYAPNNAVLVLVGDFESDKALERITELFGHIPSSGEVPPVHAVEPVQKGERRVKVRQAGPTSYVQVAYHVPEGTHQDAAALMVLDAIFSGAKPMSLSRPSAGNRSARLYRALVETELATDATSSYGLTIDPGLFRFEITARPERTAAEVEAALFAEVERLVRDGVTEAELAKARKQTRAQLAFALESVANQAYWLGYFEVLGGYERFDSFADDLAAVTPEQVQAVARAYLHEDNRTVGTFLPTAGSTPGQSPAGAPFAGLQRHIWPLPVFYRDPAGAGAGIGPETVLREVLPNGVTVLAYRNASAPSLVVAGDVKAGAVLDPEGLWGLAAFTGEMLERGTARRTFQQLNEELDSVGASIRVGAGGHTAGFVGKALTEDADLLMDIVSDVLLAPSFPEDEMRKLRGEVLADLREMEDDTGHVASRLFRELLYPPSHPYHYRTTGYTASVESLTRGHIEAFYRRYYDPRNLTVVVVGDMEPSAAVDMIRRYFGDWKPSGEVVEWRLPPVSRPEAARRSAVAMADKAQADLVWGFVGLERSNPDYYAAHLTDLIWGQLGMFGRLGEYVRDELGLAYYVYSRLDAGFGPGPWSVRAGVNPVNIDRCLEAIATVSRRLLREPVSEQELGDAKSFLVGSMPLRLETNEGLAATIISIESFGLGLDYVQRYPQIIAAVQADDMLDVARRYIDPEHAVLAIAGPDSSQGAGGSVARAMRR